jgi:transposase
MENILDVYRRPFDPDNRLVCLDEKPFQLIGHAHGPIIKKDGSVLEDYEYVRNGTAQIVMCFEPLAGKRHVKVKDTNNRFDWVDNVSGLLDNEYRDVPLVTLVQDNHSAHRPEAFYEVYSPEKAKQYLDRLVFEFTPAHGSWLNMAEFELSVLSRQGLKRFSCKEELVRAVDVWQTERNHRTVKADWQFTKEDARVKLKSLYPSI